jgi:hypothetical protein
MTDRQELYCPNCNGKLQDSTVEECWNCHARFGAGSAWKPTTTPSKRKGGMSSGCGCSVLILVFVVAWLAYILSSVCLICK